MELIGNVKKSNQIVQLLIENWSTVFGSAAYAHLVDPAAVHQRQASTQAAFAPKLLSERKA